MRNIFIERGTYIPAFKRKSELVERKGLGHPDSIVDGIAEEISRELSKEYINNFGKILHHNVDKTLLVAGEANPVYGGGSFIKPIYILLAGRATEFAEEIHIPVQSIAIKTAKDYLKKAVRNLDVETDVIIDSRIASGSKDLVELFLRGPKIPYANDTSFGTGYAPFDELERCVYEIENHLNSKEYKERMKMVGEDIKVMGTRWEDKIIITIALAFVSRHINNIEEYIKAKERIKQDAMNIARKITPKEVIIDINTADDEEKESIYLTVSGTSAEMGDDGEVGRGNRVNGLITPMRSMTLEAAAGKNPVSHVGKIYSILSFEIASQIVQEYPDIEDVTITLLSQIGKPIDQPKTASAQIIANEEIYKKYESKVHYLIDKNLEEITEITNKIVFGKVRVF